MPSRKREWVALALDTLDGLNVLVGLWDDDMPPSARAEIARIRTPLEEMLIAEGVIGNPHNS